MKSLYLVIKPSKQVDDLGNFFPDIMTLPINKFVYKNNPLTVTLTSGDIDRLDLLSYAYYQTSDYTDILLWLNNIGDIHTLNPGDKLTIPDPADITNFYLGFI